MQSLHHTHRMATVPHPPLNGIHQWLPSAARAMRRLGLTDTQAIEALRGYEQRLRRPYQHREVEDAVALVYNTAPRSTAGPRRRRVSSQRLSDIRFDPERLARIAAGLPEADALWFKQRSPVFLDGMEPERYLHAITNAGDRILCFKTFKSQGQHLWQNLDGLCLTNGPLSRWSHGLRDGAWFLPQPVTGEFLEIDRRKSTWNPSGRSRRAEENVTSFRFALLESDDADSAHWLSALAQLPLPIVSVVTSGGKSIHALFLVNAESKLAWDEVVRGVILPPMKAIGADAAALTAVRLTRLPCIHREGRLQELLFLNSAPNSEPIANLPPAPTHVDFS